MDGYYNIIFACDLCPCQDILSKTCLFSRLNYMTYHHIVGGGAFATWCAMNHHIASTKYVHFLPTQWPACMIMLTLKCISQITHFSTTEIPLLGIETWMVIFLQRHRASFHWTHSVLLIANTLLWHSESQSSLHVMVKPFGCMYSHTTIK
jgi:hypothetical protein